MNETSGIVMKISDNHMVVMCADGKFRNMPLPGETPKVGSQIAVRLPETSRIGGDIAIALRRTNQEGGQIAVPPGERRRAPLYRRLYAVAAVFLLIVLGGALWMQIKAEPAYVVAIDINPSMELYLDSEQRIMRAEYLNEDAAQLLKGLTMESMSLIEAMPLIMEQSVEMGYISPNSESVIMVTVAGLAGDGASGGPKAEAVEQAISKTFADNGMAGYFKVQYADRDQVNEAQTNEMSLNKIMLLRQLQGKGINLSYRSVKETSVKNIIAETGVDVAQLFEPIVEVAGATGRPAAKDSPERVQDSADEPGSSEDRNSRERQNGSGNQESSEDQDRSRDRVPDSAENGGETKKAAKRSAKEAADDNGQDNNASDKSDKSKRMEPSQKPPIDPKKPADGDQKERATPENGGKTIDKAKDADGDANQEADTAHPANENDAKGSNSLQR
jgi:hypothetical protein